MSTNIKAVFDRECAHLVFDSKMAKKLSDYRVGFEMKNSDHIEFFGGNLTGVSTVRFLTEDRDRWFETILEINETVLEDVVHDLDSVQTDFKVASDIMNISAVWMIHSIYSSKKMSDKQKEQAMIDVAMILQFKFITSRLYLLFRFPADKGIAQATYAQLSYKFAIKIHGSWRGVLEARAKEIISDRSIHIRAIRSMQEDDRVFYLITDTQSRIRDMLKNIYIVHLRAKEQNIKILDSSSVADFDGEQILKDKTQSSVAYSRYLHSIVTDKNSFIRSELTSVIENIMHTMSPRLFNSTLTWMSDNYRQPGADVIEQIIDEALIHAFDYLAQNRQAIRSASDLKSILAKLRGVYMSSRSTDPELISLRDKTELAVKNATNNKHPNILASVRTGVLLYIVARAFTMQHYTTAAVR